MPHLLVDISAHGFGHVAQTSAVLNALDCPGLRVTVRSAAPDAVLRRRIRRPFELLPLVQDHGMSMHDAMRVDVADSHRWHTDFHRDFEARVAAATAELERLQPDLLLSNIPYLSLEAAARCGVPALALCSLNWADIYRPYCGGMPDGRRIADEMVQAYARVAIFLQPEPSMAMDAALPVQPIGPIAARGRRQPQRLREAAAAPEGTRFVLVALGGLGMQYPHEHWPEMEGVRWIFPPGASTLGRADCLAESDCAMDYVDLLASCDVVMTKTGYGTQTEAVVNQVPALVIQRPDWPEEPALPDWHQTHGEVRFVSRARWQQGQFRDEIGELLKAAWLQPPVEPDGAQQAAAIVLARLTGAARG